MTRSKAQRYEFGEKNNKYFYNLEKNKPQEETYNLVNKRRRWHSRRA